MQAAALPGSKPAPASGIGTRAIPRRRLLTGVAGLAVAAAASPREPRAAVVNMCVVGNDGWLFPIWDNIRHGNLAQVARVTATINEAVAVLGAAGIKVAISLTPAKSRVYRDYLPGDVRFSAEAERRYDVALQALHSPGTIVLDQAGLFAAARKALPGAQYYFKADTHWNAAGAALSAINMAQLLTRGAGLPPSTRPGATLGDPEPKLETSNDLAALLPPSERIKYPPETYYLRSPVNADLLEDDAPDTVVIGNSFMQPNFGYAGVLSSELGRPVGLFWKVHQFSPYWTLLSFLRSDAFRRQRPRLIVWNFQESDVETPTDDPGAWGPNAMPAVTFLSTLRSVAVR